MNLELIRHTFTTNSTIGDLLVDGVFECFTLEDVVRPVKIPGMTAIPEGIYQIDITFSARFKTLLPELRDVPNYSGVRIHSGNTAANTEGCILVGQTKSKDFIGSSRAALGKLLPKLEAARAKGKIFIAIHRAEDAAAAGALNQRGLRSLSAPASKKRRKAKR